jgi:DNA-binding MarR family transcriptional regulator
MSAQDDNDKKMAAAMGRACVFYNIRKTTRMLTSYYDRVLSPCGLKTTQFSLLMNVLLLESATVSQLARQLGMDRTTLSRNVRLLAQKGLLRLGSGEDRREQRISLTAEGRLAIDQAIPFWQQAQSEVEKQLGQEWVKDFLSSLRRINRTEL